MAETLVKIEGLERLNVLLAQAPQEITRAGRNAINDTLRIVQRDVRATLPGRFAIRKQTFIDRQVKTGGELFATKERLSGRVVLEGPGGQRSTLEKFEAKVNPAKEKVAQGGRLAVPARGIRIPGQGGHVAPQHYLSKFLPIVTRGGAASTLRRSKGQLVRGRIKVSKTQQVGQRGSFIINLRTGYEGLVRREAKGSRKLELLWIFRKATTIPVPLDFEGTSRVSASKWLPVKTIEAVEYALKRAKLK